MDELSRQVRTLVDRATTPVTAAEVHVRAAEARRPRSSWTFAAAAVVVVALVAGGLYAATRVQATGPNVETAATPDDIPVDASVRGWTAMPAGPLGPRTDATLVPVGGDAVVVLGGLTRADCPGEGCGSELVPAEGAAVFDLTTSTWRSLPDVPAFRSPPSHAVVGDVLYLLGRTAEADELGHDPEVFLRFDLAAGEGVSTTPPEGAADRRLTVHEGRVVAWAPDQTVDGRTDLVFDEATRGWDPLPTDPLAPSAGRSVLSTSAGLVVVGHEAGDPTRYRAAVLDGGTWRELPLPADRSYGSRWFASDAGVLNVADLALYGEATVGGVLDPGTGTWESSAHPSRPSASGDRVPGVGGDRYVTVDGWLYDSRTGDWRELEAPRGTANAGQASAWVGDRLVVWGGRDPAAGVEPDQSTVLSDQGWIWTPGSGEGTADPAPEATTPSTSAAPVEDPPTTTTPVDPATPTADDPAAASAIATVVRGTFEGTDRWRFTDRCPDLDHTAELTFLLEEGGTWDYRAEFCGQRDEDDVWRGEGTFTLAAEDGSTLTGVLTSRSQLPSDGDPYGLAVTAGTGAFDGATGACEVDNHQREATFGTTEQWGTFTCELTLPADPDA